MCSYVAKSGKNKGKKCNCVAHRFSEGDYCYRHYSYIKIKAKERNVQTMLCDYAIQMQCKCGRK